jgi:transposase
MSLKPHNSYQVPQDTAEVARAIFPDGNLYLRMYDAFGTLFEDEDFATLFPQDGQPAEAPFRSRLLKGEIEKMLFEKVLACFRNKDLLKGYRQQRTDSTNVLGAIRAINRLELVGETMRRALNSLSTTVPEWMLANSHPEWIDRYGDRFEDSKLPRSETKREALAEEIGADGLTLFNSLFDNSAPGWLREIPAIKLLWRVWIQNYTWRDDERLRWRTNDELPPSSKFISSPYDEDAHYSKKRSTSWVGYKVLWWTHKTGHFFRV